MKRGRKRGSTESFKIRVKKKILEKIDKDDLIKRLNIDKKHEQDFKKIIDDIIKNSIDKTEEAISDYQKSFEIDDEDLEEDGEYYSPEDYEEEMWW